MHEITSLKDWTVDSDALGYCLPALSKKREEKKRYNVTIADLALTLVTCVSINQSILLYYPSWRDIESKYMNKPSNLKPIMNLMNDLSQTLKMNMEGEISLMRTGV